MLKLYWISRIIVTFAGAAIVFGKCLQLKFPGDTMKSVRSNKNVAAILAAGAIASALIVLPLSQAAGPGGVANGGASGASMDPATPSTQPSQIQKTQRPIGQIIAEFQSVSKQVNQILPDKVMSDASARNDAAPKAIPVLYHRLQLIDELGAIKNGVDPVTIAGLKQNSQAMLYLLNDTAMLNRVKDMISSKDENRNIEGKSVDIASRWLVAGDDKTAANTIADEVEKLDRANPANSKLTMLTMNLAQTTQSEEMNGRLMKLVTDVMTDPFAKRIQVQAKSEAEAKAKQEAMLDKPFVVSEKTVEGSEFTTADWKGKVVLVDFWATWCGPCKAGLPHVKEIYSQYHDKGLEIVGVSNDFKAKDLIDFTPKNNMPWPQLFDAAAAANHQWNPVTLNNGIHGIPCMFLIDKKGVLRSVTARADMDKLIPKLLAE